MGARGFQKLGSRGFQKKMGSRGLQKKGPGCRPILLTVCKLVLHMSRVVRKPAFCVCENKDADQLRGNREADQRLCFRYTDSTILHVSFKYVHDAHTGRRPIYVKYPSLRKVAYCDVIKRQMTSLLTLSDDIRQNETFKETRVGPMVLYTLT